MTLVGTRPESTHYVKKYTSEMYATLLLPAGVTSEASIKYKDEAELLDKADDVDKVYVEKVLPEKMKSHALQDLCFLFWQSLHFYWAEIILHHLWLTKCKLKNQNY